MRTRAIEQHQATVDLAVLVVSATGAYFQAPLGSGEEEVNEATLDAVLDLIAEDLSGEATAGLVLALSSLIVAHLGPDVVRAWAKAETDAAEGLQ